VSFQIYLDTENNFRWRLVSGEGVVIAESAEGYQSRLVCESAISLVRSTSEETPIAIMPGA
jgi:uncharacterized protein YegP (UPF0339 family)